MNTATDIPQEPLPAAITALIAQAATYSRDDLGHLIDVLRDHESNVALHPHILQLFCQYLVEKGPFLDIFIQRRAEEFAQEGLRGIQTVLQIVESTNTSSTSLNQKLTRSWPDIWHWIQYLQSCINLMGTPSMKVDQSKLATHVIWGICGNFPKSSAGHAITSTPGVLSMVADVWVQQSEWDPTDETISCNCYVVSKLLLHLLKSEAAGIKEVFSTSTESKRASIALLELIKISIKDDMSWAALPPIATSLAVLLLGHVKELDISEESISMICQVLFLHSTRSLSSSPHPVEGLHSCLSNCMQYLITAIQRPNGYIWTPCIIQGEILPSLLRCACLKVKEIDERAVVIIQVLTKHTVYRSFLKACPMVLKNPVITKIESNVPKKTAFWETWRMFKYLLKERLALKVEFDKDPRYALSCCSKKCFSVKSPRHLCGGCSHPSYCSRACQTYDWKQGGHRNQCKIIRQGQEGGSIIPTRDRSFFSFIALAELAADTSHRLRDQTSPVTFIYTNYTGAPERNVIVDLSSIPTRFSTHINPEIVPILNKIPHPHEIKPDGDLSDFNKLNLFFKVQRGGKAHVDVSVEYLTNRQARLMFDQGAPKTSGEWFRAPYSEINP
ncbi:hypothetical protein BDZ94DRAFT_1320210 [Collybia nuda]|uniref:MYND-type domain-containing protein n=1 Tax=Collybia nuda TaxID=64659 RepID=A0A9P6CME9_9AGAR|nr:hypothetical protein BDZ94DRAFT_1320210 [Collybia nuda]